MPPASTQPPIKNRFFLCRAIVCAPARRLPGALNAEATNLPRRFQGIGNEALIHTTTLRATYRAAEAAFLARNSSQAFSRILIGVRSVRTYAFWSVAVSAANGG